MTTTISQQLAAAVNQITQLQQTYAAQLPLWQAERTQTQALLNSAVSAVPNLQKNYHINSVTGSNSNAGNSSAPFATLDKALELAAQQYAGSVSIYLAEGTYSWSVGRSFGNINLSFQGLGAAKTTLNFDTSTCQLQGTKIRLNNLSLTTPLDGGVSGYAVFLLYRGASLSCGSYASGTLTPENALFRYTSAGAPLFRGENGWGFVFAERAVFENTSEEIKLLGATRNQLLIELNSIITINFQIPKTTLNNLNVGS